MWFTAALSILTKLPFVSMMTGLNVNSVLDGVGKFFSALFANVLKYWQLWLVGALIASNLFFVWEWRSTRAALVKEQAAHAADIASYKKAQADANAKAQTERAILQKESKADADQADANYAGLAAKYHASLLRYAAVKGTGSKPNNNQLPTTQSSNGPGPGPDLPATLVISGSDAEICAVNTARLQAVQQWAITLPTKVPQ